MTSTQINISHERLEEQLKLCDEDLKKMFLEFQKLKEVNHNETQLLEKRFVCNVRLQM